MANNGPFFPKEKKMKIIKSFGLFVNMCLISVLVVTGCGGGDSEPGGGGNDGLCDAACKKIDEAGSCGFSGVFGGYSSNCSYMCENQWHRDTCNSQINSRTACIANEATVTCASTGSTQWSGCDNEEVALKECTTCLPGDGDDGCCACSKSTCCAERKALLASLDAVKETECLDACADTSCQQACHAKYPSLSAARQAYDSCMKSKCGGCPCG